MKRFFVALGVILLIPVTVMLTAFAVGPSAMMVSISGATPTATATATAAGPVLVQQKTGTVASGNLTITLDTPMTIGNFLVVCVAYNATDSIPDGNIQTIENAQALALQVDVSRIAIGNQIASLTASNADSGIIILPTTGLTRISANVQEWNGVNSAPSEGTNSSSRVAGTTVSAGNVVTVSTNNLTIACGGWVANDYSSGPTNSYVRLTQVGSGSIYLESAYLIQSSALTTSTSWTLSAGINWTAATASFGAP